MRTYRKKPPGPAPETTAERQAALKRCQEAAASMADDEGYREHLAEERGREKHYDKEQAK